jgi:hypothetical protein
LQSVLGVNLPLRICFAQVSFTRLQVANLLGAGLSQFLETCRQCLGIFKRLACKFVLAIVFGLRRRGACRLQLDG